MAFINIRVRTKQYTKAAKVGHTRISSERRWIKIKAKFLNKLLKTLFVGNDNLLVIFQNIPHVRWIWRFFEESRAVVTDLAGKTHSSLTSHTHTHTHHLRKICRHARHSPASSIVILYWNTFQKRKAMLSNQRIKMFVTGVNFNVCTLIFSRMLLFMKPIFSFTASHCCHSCWQMGWPCCSMSLRW
jgi:hypothetical protein